MTARLSGLGIRPLHWAFLKAPKTYVKLYAKTCPDEYPLLPEPTRRQFKTAARILSRFRNQKGMMLADDVGLGKTTVAALIAGVFAGRGKSVRILAPNRAMVRRWRKELDRQLAVLLETAPHLERENLQRARRRLEGIANLKSGEIQVTTHGRTTPRSDRPGRAVDCDLLIVDEAHRARSEASRFGRYLDRKRDRFGRVLLLTATPFSLSVSEMKRALRLVGADDETRQLARKFGRLLDELWYDSFSNPQDFGKRLGEAGALAVKALRIWVIRHGVEHLPEESKRYGEWMPWAVTVCPASGQSIEVLVRAIRAFDLAKKTGAWKQSRTNDPRFHQGWAYLANVIRQLPSGTEASLRGTHTTALEHHRRWVKRTLLACNSHEKIKAAVAALAKVVFGGEKVLVFCDHHATAQELALAAGSGIKVKHSDGYLTEEEWRDAWRIVLNAEERELFKTSKNLALERARFHEYIKWLSCKGIRLQVLSWLPSKPRSVKTLVRMLCKTHARRNVMADTVQRAAGRLFRELNDPESRSTRAVLLEGSKHLPGWGKSLTVVVSTAKDPKGDAPRGVFFETEPDTIMSIFNSPFGPDVLIATDKLSEGVDLHRSCRHIMQYELDPSPIRTVQRRGRIRRIGSWASVTGEPIMEAYPALMDTRDRALVQIMKQRLGQFDLLLGGVGDIEMDLVADDAYARQHDALEVARSRLERLSLAVARRSNC